ncbi:MAG TPA: DUF3618 domain-containing protein [Trebonia sp.]
MTTQGTAGRADAAATPASDNPQQLEAEIEQTREQFGETAEAPAAKTDVKARTQDKVRQLAGRLEGMAGQARQQAAAAVTSISEATPEPVQRTAAKAAATARRRRAPLAVIAGGVVLAWRVITWWRRR